MQKDSVTHDESPMMDCDGYPIKQTLKKIKNWDHTDNVGLFKYMRAAWKYPQYFRIDEEKGTVKMSTVGWSGNEQLVVALQKNYAIMGMCWIYSRRGGHHKFQLFDLW